MKKILNTEEHKPVSGIIIMAMRKYEKMKDARKILNNAGLSLFILVVIFSITKDLVLVPVMSKLWGWTLMTTPYGFISNANLGETLLKSPWIILVGILLIGIYLFFSLWQVAAIVIGVAYACEDKRIRARDVLRISFTDIQNGFRPKNFMLLFYTAIILPFTNIFQATEFIDAFAIPEYIKDFIDNNVYLHLLYVFLFVAAIYLALRWFYLLPAFFLRELNYKTASRESFALTKKHCLKNGLLLAVYGFIEALRLFILPLIIIMLSCAVAYFFVYDQPYASALFSSIAINSATETCSMICGEILYLSVMCYIVNNYHTICERDSKKYTLPVLNSEAKNHFSGKKIYVIVNLLAAFCIVIFYLASVWAVSSDPSSIYSIINCPTIVAHKGYSSVAPENTMDAFDAAAKSENVDYIELDVWSTKDGIPVVVHNASIKAATGIDGFVYDYSYEELQAIPATYSYEYDKFPNARIPGLEEVISTYADTTPLLIEIKGYKKDEKLPEKIVALMEKYNCTDTSMIHSGDYSALKAVKLCNPDIKCGLILAVITGEYYDLPYADFFSVEHSFVTQNMIKQLHKRDKEIYVWTVNLENSVDKLKSMNIDGCITDYPDKIAELLDISDTDLDDIVNSIQQNVNEAIDNDEHETDNIENY